MMTHFWLFQGILGLLLVVAILAACTPMMYGIPVEQWETLNDAQSHPRGPGNGCRKNAADPRTTVNRVFRPFISAKQYFMETC
jgi:hypothetical protein